MWSRAPKPRPHKPRPHKPRPHKPRAPKPLTWLAALLAAYLTAPLIAGLLATGEADWRGADAPALLRATLVSVETASIATFIIAIGGVPLGYFLARRQSRAFSALGFIVQAPLALPPLVSGVLLLFLVGYDGPIGKLTNGAFTDSIAGIVIAEVFVAAPFLIIAARSAFAAMDSTLEGVAAVLGRSPAEIFFQVSLPVAWPAIVSGLMLAWLRAFGEFGATIMVAYHPYSLPVYTYVAFGAQGLPAMLPVLFPTIAVAFVVMGLNAAGHRRLGAHWPIGLPMRRRLADGARPIPKAGASALEAAVACDAIFAFDLVKRLDSFLLEAAWSTRGRRLAILGPSGSGKSLLLKLLAGLEGADRARIALGSRELSGLNPADRAVAYVPQNYGLFPHLSVIEQLRFAVGAKQHSIDYWVDRLGLADLVDRPPAALSMGQQQRVALARALVRPADLILLDEPFSALDAPLRAALRSELLSVQNESSAKTILVTHDPLEAALLADEILLLVDGRALQVGATKSVFSRPSNEQAARLLGIGAVAEGVALDAATLEVGQGLGQGLGQGSVLRVCGAPLTPGLRYGWAVAPEQIRLRPDGACVGRVEAVAPLGLGRQITLDFSGALLPAFNLGLDVNPGDLCRFDVDPRAVQLWPAAGRAGKA